MRFDMSVADLLSEVARCSMEIAIPEGWVADSQTLYLHSSGVRIERMTYRKKEGWVLVPVDLDQKVMEFSPDRAGLEGAFAAFAEGGLDPKGTGLPKKTSAAQDAARRDEKLEEASDDEEKAAEAEDEDES